MIKILNVMQRSVLILLMVIMFILSIKLMSQGFIDNSKNIEISKEINNWNIGACYTVQTDDPFDNTHHQMKILDYKKGYMLSQHYYGYIKGWSSSYSVRDDGSRSRYIEIQCPMSIWNYIK